MNNKEVSRYTNSPKEKKLEVRASAEWVNLSNYTSDITCEFKDKSVVTIHKIEDNFLRRFF